MTKNNLQLSLYYSPTCPYCHRVLDALVDLGANPDLKAGHAGNVILCDRGQSKHKEDLVNGGGKTTVPCLKIKRDDDTQWMYESLDIIDFLKKNIS